MKAIVNTKYGPPEVVELREVEKPVPEEDEVLLKVYASTVNRTDCGFRSAKYFISRLWSGLFRPKIKIWGSEYAGIIEEIGDKVTKFKKGDRVFGYNDNRFGGHAEYLAIKQNDALAVMPGNFTYEEAAPLTEGAHYALCDIRASRIKKGQNALVYGASGAIGSSALQLLKNMEVYVTAVCNTANTPLMKTLGADDVVDYQTHDFTKTGKRYDLVFDAVGKSSFKTCKPLLKDKGVYISTEPGKNGVNIVIALITSFTRGKKVLFPIPEIKNQDLEFLKELAEKGKFRPVIDRIYKLEEITEAYKYVDSGRKTGNVVLRIADASDMASHNG